MRKRLPSVVLMAGINGGPPVHLSEILEVSGIAAALRKLKPEDPPETRLRPHPRATEMVISAVKNLKEPGGSSLQAIKKYITTNYKVNADKLAPHIKKSITQAVTSGALVQTKGKGVSGSFKLPSEKKKKPTTVAAKARKTTNPKKSAAAKKSKATPTKTKKTTAKVSAAAASPKKVGAKKPKVMKDKAKTKTPVKAKASPKKAKGTLAKKPKSPKPKKAPAKAKAAPKKAAKK